MSFRPRVENVGSEKLWGRAGHVTARAGPPLVLGRLSARRDVSWGADVTEPSVGDTHELRIPGAPLRRPPSDQPCHPRARVTLEMEIR